MVPNPRNYLPSRAHPEHREHRKKLEKEHAFGFTEAAALGMIGLTLAWNIENQVRKHEERHEKEEEEKKKREEKERRRRERRSRSEYRSEPAGRGSDSGSTRRSVGGDGGGYTERRDGGGGAAGTGGYDPRRRMSVAGYRPEPEYQLSHGHRDVRPRWDPREDPRYNPNELRYETRRYDDRRQLDDYVRGRSR